MAYGSSSATLRAVARTACLTSSGVHVGRASRSSATAPDITAADMDVPLPRR